MADGFAAKDASGATVEILTDEVTDGTLGTGQKQLIGVVDATINGTNKLIVDSSGRAKVDASGVAVPVTDNAGSLTVDDGGGSLTVDGSVGISGTATVSGTVAVSSVGGTVTADTELTTADLDTGAGTDTKAVVGIARAESGGSVLVGSANPLPISGTVAGGSNVFHVDDNSGSLTVDGTVAVSASPAAARTTDSISAALATDAIMNGTTVLTPKFAPISVSASGVTTLIAAVASHKLRVLGFFIVAAGAVTVKLQSHTTTTQATGTMSFAANGGVSVPFSPMGWFESVSGEALDINLGGAVSVGGMVAYVEV